MLLLCWNTCAITQKNAYELLKHTWSSSVISINAGTLILLIILRAQIRIHARSLGSLAGRESVNEPVMLTYFRVTDLKGPQNFAFHWRALALLQETYCPCKYNMQVWLCSVFTPSRRLAVFTSMTFKKHMLLFSVEKKTLKDLHTM